MSVWTENTKKKMDKKEKEYEKRIEKAYENRMDRNKAFIHFWNMHVDDFKGLTKNSKFFEREYTLNFEPIGVVNKDYPLSAKLYFGNRPFSIHQEESSNSLLSESGASLHFDQQPNGMVSIILQHPVVGEGAPFNGLNLGLIKPYKLLKKCYQKRLCRVLVTSMENYSFAGKPSCIDKLLILRYNEIYPQIKEGRECESLLRKHLCACAKWTICAIVGGLIAGFTASRFPTTIEDSQFERYDSVLVQSKEDISSIKQELSNITEGLNLQLDSLNQTIRKNRETMVEEIKRMKNKVTSK